MIRPFELFVALRYVHSRDTGFFVSFITWVSLLGVALGVAALITILSVMNGFEGELRDRLLSLSAHATLVRGDGAPVPEAAIGRVRQMPGVAAATLFVETQALLIHGGEMRPATLRGIDPAQEGRVTRIDSALLATRLGVLDEGSDRLVLGRALAFELGVGVGDEVTVMVPATGEGGELSPRIRSFTVAGLFEVGLQDHDSVLAMTSLADARALLPSGGVSGIRVRFDDVFMAPSESTHVVSALGLGWNARDWTMENASYFRAIRIEKTMMTLILLLVVAVAVFNIVAMLVMVVRAKRTDIAILRTLGLSARSVVMIFVAQGVAIGWLGTGLGVFAGVMLAGHVETVAAWLERLLRFHILDADVYYVTRIPSVIDVKDVVAIGGLALVLTLLATVYPAKRAAATEPAEALRYE